MQAPCAVVVTSADISPVQNRRYQVLRLKVVFIPGDDEEAVMVFAHSAYCDKFVLSQVSPCRIVPVCMLWKSFGMTNATLGSVL